MVKYRVVSFIKDQIAALYFTMSDISPYKQIQVKSTQLFIKAESSHKFVCWVGPWGPPRLFLPEDRNHRTIIICIEISLTYFEHAKIMGNFSK